MESFLVVLSLISCKSDPSKPTPTETAGTATDRKEWAVADVTLTSGKKLVVNFRSVAPLGITPSDFSSRVSIRCPYPDRGDGAGLPTKERLHELQALEKRLASPSAIRLMSKTGDGARESIFQVKRSDDFTAVVPRTTKELGLECSFEVAEDGDWTLWRTTTAQLADDNRRGSADDHE